MFGFLRGYFSNDMAIDLGTANTLIYVRIPASFWTNHPWSPFGMTVAPVPKEHSGCRQGSQTDAGPRFPAIRSH